MTPKNLTMFRIPPSLRLVDIDDELARIPRRPVAPTEQRSMGFASPIRDSAALTHRVDGAIWIALAGEERILPPAAVNLELQKRINAIEDEQGRRLGGAARKKIKDEVLFDMLPKAPIVPVRLDVFIDPRLELVMVSTSSQGQAEAAISLLREALGSFPALPLNAEVDPRAVMTAWVGGEPLPDGLIVGSEAELRDPSDKGAVVKVQRQELDSDEIQRHLEAGKQITMLALSYNDAVAFVWNSALSIKKLELLAAATEKLDSLDADDLASELDARFALFLGEMRSLWPVLEASFKLSRIAE